MGRLELLGKRSKFATARSGFYKSVAVIGMASLVVTPALAGPAPTPTNFNQTTAGAVSQTVPDGVCGVSVIAAGGGGGSAALAGSNGSAGGNAAVVNASFKVLPLQAVAGTIAAGGGGATPTGGTGNAAGGAGGTVFVSHRGAGGGGSTAVSVGTVKVVEAGGGGGGGASHNAAGSGGNGGITGIAGGVAAGVNGSNGFETGATVNGGRGGQIAAGGAGGVNTGGAAFNGFAGAGIGSGGGGNGGSDNANDSGGGGGGGYTGGGGGAATFSDTVTGAGGGGGSSFVRTTSPVPSASAPTGVSAAAATAPNPGAGGAINTTNNGRAGRLALNWTLCNYTLGVTKSATPNPVNAGAKTVWSINVTNSGPDPMTRGDTISLTETLPTPVTGTPTYRVVSVTSSGGSNADMASGAFTCTGVTVGSTMPASTTCSRPYAAPSAPGAPSGGTRGLNAGETLTISFEQIIPNTSPCQTISNTASTADRVGTRTGTNTVTIACYDLAVVKTPSAATIAQGAPITWSVAVTNIGPGNMMGPDATATNALTVTDTAPTGSVGAPSGFTSTGPLAGCTYTSPTISCPTGLAAGATQTFTFQQAVNAGATIGTIVNNTATVSDFKTGDTNDSGPASFTVRAPSADLSIVKTNGGTQVTAGGTTTYTLTVTNNGSDSATGARVTDVPGSGLNCPASNPVTITGDGVPAGSFTIANLTGAGIVLGTLNVGQAAVLTFTCNVP